MPSPFPGMDPYLEEPGMWPDVHHGLISQSQAALNRQLRPKYYVRVEERVYISDETDPGRAVIIPDLRVSQASESSAQQVDDRASPASPAVAEPVVVTTLIDDEIHEARLEVVDRADRNVVTVIEVLSPTNKVAGSRGRESYLQKRHEIMHSPCHFVEIDLLRGGVPIHAREILPRADYYVHVSHRDRRPKGLVWPILLTQRLPAVRIPLKPEDADATLDLQQVLDTAYDCAAYDLAIDYGADPVPPLDEEVDRWADGLLRSRGLR